MGCCLSRCCIRKLGGEWADVTKCYSNDAGLSEAAIKLVNDAFNGLDVTKIVDVHVHLIGLHPQESGCYAHENMDDCCRCKSYGKKWLIMQASGMDISAPDSDRPYYQRLVQLFENYIPLHLQTEVKQQLANEKGSANLAELRVNDDSTQSDEEEKKAFSDPPDLSSPLLERDDRHAGYGVQGVFMDRPVCPKVVLLGLDQVYNKETGIAEPHNTSVYTPESYVEQVCDENRHVFLLGPSINPYRKDCLSKLEYFKNKGCNLIKWLPNSMAIDPMDSLCDAFYDKLVELDMFLLSHTGQEHSLDDADYTVQEYGNPLRFRNALEKGCKIIMAHCASEGSDEDLDAMDTRKPVINSCDLFIRMMREDKYKHLLYGDISAITAFKRVDNLVKVIQCSDIHDRLIYGSDYPVPAINATVWYGRLVSNGLITQAQATLLREIYKFNPLLADFVGKRIMRYTDTDGNVHRFSDKIFQQFPLLCGYNYEKNKAEKKNE